MTATLYQEIASHLSTVSVNAYTREDDLEDGILVDASEAARRAGIFMPVALTEAAWRDCISWDETDNDRKAVEDSEEGRLSDVVMLAAAALHTASHRRYAGTEILFPVWRIPRAGLRRMPLRVVLRLTLGFEDGEMVGMIGLASELN